MYKSPENQLDPLDREILEKLIKNARIPFTQLAEELRVSNSFVHQRVKKMRKAGIIGEPVFVVNPESLGYETCAFVQLMVTRAAHVPDILSELEKIPQIVECSNVAGRYDVMVKIYAINNAHLRDIIYDRIQTIPEVEGTNTVISFETTFTRGVPLRPEG